jgi:hypothetical protein
VRLEEVSSVTSPVQVPPVKEPVTSPAHPLVQLKVGEERAESERVAGPAKPVARFPYTSRARTVIGNGRRLNWGDGMNSHSSAKASAARIVSVWSTEAAHAETDAVTVTVPVTVPRK